MASNHGLTRLSQLEKQLKNYKNDKDTLATDKKNRFKVFLGILQSICDFVRETDGSPNFQNIITNADLLLNDAIKYAYEKEFFENIPSFAHSDTNPSISSQIIEDGAISHDMLTTLLSLLNIRFGKKPTDPFKLEPGMNINIPKGPEPWLKTMRPHPFSTRLSRFRGDVAVSATSDTPIANMIYEARCEISDVSAAYPIDLTLSTDGACLVLIGAGGYKNRAPFLQYHFPTDGVDSLSDYVVKTGLSNIAYYTTTDAKRKLIFVADEDRIKSFAWGSPSGGVHGMPTHTMNTGRWGGPLAILGESQILRAGHGSVGVWDLDSLETHGPNGDRLIGGAFDTDDMWRDNSEDIEPSDGSTVCSTIQISDKVPGIVRWHAHPSTLGVMLCGPDPSTGRDFSCFALDLERGKLASRYIGHGGSIQQFSTSSGDLNTFITACDDGYARLYDIRHPLPVLTLDSAGQDSDCCTSSVLVHPDGIPTVFTGAERKEQINMWDIRARSVVYELSTGNNTVTSMVWDSNHNTLYAATRCDYIMDRIGSTNGYRRAIIPRGQTPVGIERAEEDEDHNNDIDEEDDDDIDYDGRCWPQRAYHSENHFGYLFDANDDKIYRYAFRENPDASLVPSYGQAMLVSDSYW